MKTLKWKHVFALLSVALLFVTMTATPQAQAAPPKVVCVPWYSPNPAIPHDTWNGKEITLKGTAHDPDGDVELATYEWDFGDGNLPSSGVVTDPYEIEAKHTYIGSIGDSFVATLTVTDINGESDSDGYLIEIRDGSVLAVQVNVAIDEGLWRLHKDMTRGTYGDGAEYAYLPYGSYSASATGGGIEAFEIHGHLPDGNAEEDPYVETVQRGLNYLLNQMHAHGISPYGANDPDTNGNGIGLGCYTSGSRSMYECGITLMTFASSKAPGRIALTGPANVIGRTYLEIVQDMIDYLAYGQNDANRGVYRGGWRYSANYGQSDNSCSQWPAIGMEAAETNYGAAVTVPQFVRDELSLWIDYIQNDSSGGSGYTSPGSWVNVAKTGGLLCEMKLFGDDTTVLRVTDAVSFICANWDSTAGDYGNLGDYYAMYSVMKGFTLLGIEQICPLDSGFYWYSDPDRGYAPYLVEHQNPDGSWPSSIRVTHPLTTAWAILILQLTPVEPGPIADAGDDVPSHPPIIEVEFDGSGSYHRDPAKEIVQYCWDFDASDGIDWDDPDYCSAEPTASHAYPAVYNPDGTIDWAATTKDYTATLRVTDNSDPAKTDTDECIVHITGPPWPPVADPDGPYTAGKCEVITLDGSASYDPEAELYPDPEHPWHGELVSWEWDLDNNGIYDDAIGEMVDWSSCIKGLYVIGLKVTDNMGDSDAQDTVINVANRPPEADADGPYCCSLGEITFDGSGSTDPDPDETETLEYRWDFESDGIYDTAWSTDPTATYTYPVCEEYTATLQVKDIDGGTDTDTADVVPHVPIPVDIKPTSCPNPFNVDSRGVLPVAILGTEDFDVTMVDPASARLIGVAPLRCSLEDVVTPFEPLFGKESEFDCTEEGPDGYLDLTLKFDTQEVVEALGEITDGAVIVLTLKGNLLEEHGGIPIIGEDVIIIRKKGK
jgi:hypothetical protein